MDMTPRAGYSGCPAARHCTHRRIGEACGLNLVLQWTAGGYVKNSLSQRHHQGEKNPVERYVDEVILWGSPERVADLLLEYEEEKQLNYLLCAPLSNVSFQLFNDEVLARIS